MTRCNNWICVLATLLLVTGNSHAQTQFHFQHYDSRDGLASDQANSIARDSLGFVWVGYAGGLSRFDGYNFKVFRYDEHDPSRNALSLIGNFTTDTNGNVWIEEAKQDITLPRTLVMYNWKTDSFVKYKIDTKGAYANRWRFEKSSPTVWIGTINGLFNFNTLTNVTSNCPNPDDTKGSNNIRDIKDLGPHLLLATNNGLWIFNKTTQQHSRPKCEPRDSSQLYHSPIWTLMDNPYVLDGLWLKIDIDGKLGRGMIKIKIDSTYSIINRVEFPENIQMQWYAWDEEEVIWFTSIGNKGFFRFDARKNEVMNIGSELDKNPLGTNLVNRVLIDRDGNLWIATNRGISCMPKRSLSFINYQLPDIEASTLYSARDKEYLLLAQKAKGHKSILMAPLARGTEGDLQFKRLPTDQVRGQVVQNFWKGKNFLWMGFAGGGGRVIGLPINHQTGMMEISPLVSFLYDPANPNTLLSPSANQIWEDPAENLWVRHHPAGMYPGGLSKVKSKVKYGIEGSVARYQRNKEDSNSLVDNTVYNFLPESEKSLWVLTEGGTDLMHFGDDDHARFEHVFDGKVEPHILFRASDSTLFYGARKGLFQAMKKPGSGVWNSINLLGNIGGVQAIQEDGAGRLWLNADGHLICYDRQRKIAMQFNRQDGIDHLESYVYMHHTQDGRMIIDGGDGFTVFDPLTFKFDNRKITPLITDLKLNNKSVTVALSDSTQVDFKMTESITSARELTLDYLHNNFTLEFSAMEMTAPEKNLYKHMLESYDKDWIETDYKNRTATYTNLPAGEYTFRVKASNHHGVWSDNERTLKVIILPPPWRTWWAYVSYALIVISVIVWARNNLVQRERLKANLALSKVEQEKEHFELEKAKEVDKVKTSFFTNISHEFRTPLTLIKGPVQDLLEKYTNDTKTQGKLKLVQRNSDLLLKLINQLLDLAKLESGSLRVEKTEGDVFSFVRAIASSFESFARQKNVSIRIDVPSESYAALFDKDKLETILINLINNAIKFTPSGGSVTVDLTPANAATQHTPSPKERGASAFQSDVSIDNLKSSETPLSFGEGAGGLSAVAGVRLTVKDTGIGIPSDQQQKIFERFHQVSEAHKEVGTGIGLALVKELVALMGGEIEVTSEVGKGSEFHVLLPVELVASSVLRVTSPEQTIIERQMVQEVTQTVTRSTEPETRNPELATILVVEDNTDLRHFIIDSLGNEFHFLEAENGKQGLDIATSEVPDLIISDVMMPVMDGITMAGKIKSDIRSSHIPLILLTAKSTEDSKLSGLQSGADDYLTKPFNKNELLLKVRNGVTRQLKLREKLRAELMSTAPKVEVLSADEQFLMKVKDTILNRLSDEQLSVESLADDIGLSRVQLYRKITALTGISVNELIRKLRLQKASQLLAQNWGPVSQVAYEVGFSNLSYFSKVFKEEFGVLPSEYNSVEK